MGSSSLIIVFTRVIDVTLEHCGVYLFQGSYYSTNLVSLKRDLGCCDKSNYANLNNPMTYIAYALGLHWVIILVLV